MSETNGEPKPASIPLRPQDVSKYVPPPPATHNVEATIYEPSTGEIVAKVNAPDTMVQQQLRGAQKAVAGEGLDGNEVYYGPGLVPTPRPELVLDRLEITANGIDAATLAAAPRGTEVFLDGVSQGKIGEGFRFSAREPGEYRLEFKPPFPYKPARVVVRAKP